MDLALLDANVPTFYSINYLFQILILSHLFDP